MSDENRELERFLKGHMSGRNSLTLLEAGCGSMSHVGIEGVERAVGIDLSEAQLERNTSLHEKIVGNLETYPLPARTFDVIVCWNVLEHVSDPLRVMENFLKALKDRGLIVLAYPNLLSLKGLVTKLTPFKIHVYFYRYIIGDRRKTGFDQFPTYLRAFLIPERLRRFAESRGLSVRYFKLYEGPVQKYWRQRSKWANLLFAFLGWGSRKLTGDRTDLNLTDCLMVIEK